MPVRRFPTHKAARVALWSSPKDPKLPERLRRWWRTCAQFSRTQAPQGVRRFATIEQANAEREGWTVVARIEGAPPPTAD